MVFVRLKRWSRGQGAYFYIFLEASEVTESRLGISQRSVDLRSCQLVSMRQMERLKLRGDLRMMMICGGGDELVR